MKTFVSVVGFSLLTIGFFAAYSSFGIPQIEPAPPPEQEALDLGAMSMQDFIALGARIYEGKGTCTLCHNAVGGRAPLLDQAAVVATERLADANYKGEATDVADMTEEESAAVMAGWAAWMQRIGSALTDVGAPFGPGVSVVDDGSSAAPVAMSGYSIVEAEDLAAAEALTAGHPYLSDGKGDFSIELYELLPVPV